MEIARVIILAVGVAFAFITQATAATIGRVPAVHSVTIDNTKPRLDTNGNTINAHDGTIKFFDRYWYYHAAEYALCHEPAKHGCDQTADHCGFHPNHNVSIWRSPDLSSGSWPVNDCGFCIIDAGVQILMYTSRIVLQGVSRTRYAMRGTGGM